MPEDGIIVNIKDFPELQQSVPAAGSRENIRHQQDGIRENAVEGSNQNGDATTANVMTQSYKTPLVGTLMRHLLLQIHLENCIFIQLLATLQRRALVTPTRQITLLTTASAPIEQITIAQCCSTTQGQRFRLQQS